MLCQVSATSYIFAAVQIFSIYISCILDEMHEWQEKKIWDTKKLMIGFAQDEIKCKIKEN